MHIGYFDEFGHIGPYVSPGDRRYKTHPAFGFGGIVLPADRVRDFSSFFYRLRNNLLADEITAKGANPHTWEKKGSSLLTTQNITAYPELRQAINRILNRIGEMEGRIFFYGQVKPVGPPAVGMETSRQRYDHCMIQTVIRQQYWLQPNDRHMMIFDEIDDKSRLEAMASIRGFMFSDHRGRKLLEPPMQVESHLFLGVQAADWICAILSRLSAYRFDPSGWAQFEWADKYFSTRIADITMRRSKIWNPLDPPTSLTKATL